MRKILLFTMLFGLTFLLSACFGEEIINQEESDEEVIEEVKKAEKLTEEWLRSTPTYKERGGDNLKIVEMEEKEDGIYEVFASFETDYPGYGKIDSELATALKETEHEAHIIIENNEIVQAMLNEEFDMIEEVRHVEITESEIDWLKEVINREQERREEEPLDGKELQEVAEDRALRNAVVNLLFDEWEVVVSHKEICEELMKIIKKDGWEEIGITDIETFFEFQSEERGYSSQEIIDDIKFEIQEKKLYGMISRTIEVDEETIEANEEEFREIYKEYTEESGGFIPYEEFFERFRLEILEEEITGAIIEELDRKLDKSILVVIEGDAVMSPVKDELIELEEDLTISEDETR